MITKTEFLNYLEKFLVEEATEKELLEIKKTIEQRLENVKTFYLWFYDEGNKQNLKCKFFNDFEEAKKEAIKHHYKIFNDCENEGEFLDLDLFNVVCFFNIKQEENFEEITDVETYLINKYFDKPVSPYEVADFCYDVLDIEYYYKNYINSVLEKYIEIIPKAKIESLTFNDFKDIKIESIEVMYSVDYYSREMYFNIEKQYSQRMLENIFKEVADKFDYEKAKANNERNKLFANIVFEDMCNDLIKKQFVPKEIFKQAFNGNDPHKVAKNIFRYSNSELSHRGILGPIEDFLDLLYKVFIKIKTEAEITDEYKIQNFIMEIFPDF